MASSMFAGATELHHLHLHNGDGKRPFDLPALNYEGNGRLLSDVSGKSIGKKGQNNKMVIPFTQRKV